MCFASGRSIISYAWIQSVFLDLFNVSHHRWRAHLDSLLLLAAATACWIAPSGAEQQQHSTFQQCASTGATARSCRNALFKETHKLFSQIEREKKKLLCAHTGDPTRHDGKFMHHLVLSVRGIPHSSAHFDPSEQKPRQIQVRVYLLFRPVRCRVRQADLDFTGGAAEALLAQ